MREAPHQSRLARATENVSHPISLEQLRAVAGVSTRALQVACLARWSQSPVELVASRQLETARSLLSSGRMPTVTAAALRSGFSHLGRFSIAYKRGFRGIALGDAGPGTERHRESGVNDAVGDRTGPDSPPEAV
jgi:transcriptional regulator GlxA family with amidase domain